MGVEIFFWLRGKKRKRGEGDFLAKRSKEKRGKKVKEGF
jgi:hypothetical protein